MLDLATVTRAHFEPALQQDFELLTGTGSVTLALVAAEARGSAHAGGREPFALTFRGAPVLRLPQAIYQLQNVTLGPLEIFLVQSGATAEGSFFEAIFN